MAPAISLPGRPAKEQPRGAPNEGLTRRPRMPEREEREAREAPNERDDRNTLRITDGALVATMLLILFLACESRNSGGGGAKWPESIAADFRALTRVRVMRRILLRWSAASAGDADQRADHALRPGVGGPRTGERVGGGDHLRSRPI